MTKKRPAAQKRSAQKSAQTLRQKQARKKKAERAKWHLKLYVAGMTGHSEAAFRNLQFICELHLKGKYKIEVIDLIKHPQLARGDQIFAIPTLIKKVPKPARKIIGDLSDTEKLLVGLDLKPIGKF